MRPSRLQEALAYQSDKTFLHHCSDSLGSDSAGNSWACRFAPAEFEIDAGCSKKATEDSLAVRTGLAMRRAAERSPYCSVFVTARHEAAEQRSGRLVVFDAALKIHVSAQC